MFPRSPLGFTDIQIADGFHHPVQAQKYEFQSLRVLHNGYREHSGSVVGCLTQD